MHSFVGESTVTSSFYGPSPDAGHPNFSGQDCWGFASGNTRRMRYLKIESNFGMRSKAVDALELAPSLASTSAPQGLEMPACRLTHSYYAASYRKQLFTVNNALVHPRNSSWVWKRLAMVEVAQYYSTEGHQRAHFGSSTHFTFDELRHFYQTTLIPC